MNQPTTIVFHAELSTDRPISSLLSEIVPPPNIILSVEELVDFTKVSKNVRRGHTDIARPPNSFMIYRREFLARKRNGMEGPLNMNRISIEAAARWKSESPEVKDFFAKVADVVREIHHKNHPYYKYTPRKTPKKKRVRRTPKPWQYERGGGEEEQKVVVCPEGSACCGNEPSGGADESSSSDDEFFDAVEELSD
ncbi:5799_t:CDS:1 [Paraglomus occultum]|uniref:5799_t:CDS:1 n=1 Tax=Paraglomus occultum TaxID=144539 RepID=A0A9N9FRF9_9GLOM|nr:5799_t:CDS:1 [Paraglomus occultum]